MNPKQALQKAEDILQEYNSSVPKSLFSPAPKPHGKGMKKVKSAKAKDGGTFEVYERPAKAGQDRYQMYHAFGNGKGLDLGTHPSADGALKFARNNGIIESFTDKYGTVVRTEYQIKFPEQEDSFAFRAALQKDRKFVKAKYHVIDYYNANTTLIIGSMEERDDATDKALIKLASKFKGKLRNAYDVYDNDETGKLSHLKFDKSSVYESNNLDEARYDSYGYDVKDRWDGEKPRATGRDYFGNKMRAEPEAAIFKTKPEAEKYAKKMGRKVVGKPFKNVGSRGEEWIVMVKEAKETSIDLARRVAKNHQHEKGLDATTANVIMQVYNAVSDANKAKMEKLSVKQLANIAFKLTKNRLREGVNESRVTMVGVAAKDIKRGFLKSERVFIPKGSKLKLTSGGGDFKFFLIKATGRGVEVNKWGTIGIRADEVTKVTVE
jgi:hypothetical protein